MGDEESIKNVISVRDLLKSNLDNSKALDSALEKTGSRLHDLNRKLSSLESAVRPTTLQKCSLAAIKDQINHALGPTAAVLKVYGAVCELEKRLLSESCSNLFSYLSVIRRLEEALKFLSSNCRLAIQWLEGVNEFLEENVADDDKYLLHVRKSLEILQALQGTEEDARRNGVLSLAVGRLETEFRTLLTENTASFPLASLLSSEEQEENEPSVFPVSVIKELQAIVQRLNANALLERCKSIYVTVRTFKVQNSLEALDLEYLDMSITEFDDWQSIETHINQWAKHLELAVKHLYEPEYNLCKEIFEVVGPEIWTENFGNIVIQSGFLAFLRFGKRITDTKDDPMKLLKLLDIFSVLHNLRMNFNRLFGGESCADIRALTRELIRQIIDQACRIFLELPAQVKLQRGTSPPPDGSVPKLVNFVTNYCNRLLGDDYREVLTQVLEIHQNWKHEDRQEGLLTSQVYAIMIEIARNLDAWSKKYQDTSQSYFFMMNNHCHFSNLKGTKITQLMGECWSEAHEQYRDYYVALYLRESWGRILTILCQDDPTLFSGGRATARESLKKNLKEFNDSFESIYQKQSCWVVSDDILRKKMCKLLVQAIVPVYKNFMLDYVALASQNVSPSKQIKYTSESLENKLNLLFKPKLRNYGITKNKDMLDKVRHVVASQFLHMPVTAR